MAWEIHPEHRAELAMAQLKHLGQSDLVMETSFRLVVVEERSSLTTLQQRSDLNLDTFFRRPNLDCLDLAAKPDRFIKLEFNRFPQLGLSFFSLCTLPQEIAYVKKILLAGRVG